MCWVMPPASPATTLALRMRSSSVVLPWSTWPMTVMTGGARLAGRVVVVVVVVVEQRLQLDLLLLAGLDEQDLGADSRANSSICSSVSDCVAVTISPASNRKRTTSAAVRFSLGASSWA